MNRVEVHQYKQDSLGLEAIFAIDRVRGDVTSIGGCRIFPYENEHIARVEAVHLASTLSKKYKFHGMHFNGCKFVVYSFDPNKRVENFEQIGLWLNEHQGKCYLATDIGSSINDMEIIGHVSPYVVELPKNLGELNDCGGLTTEGVLKALEAALFSSFGDSSFSGKTVYVQGLGKLGMSLSHWLISHGAFVSGYDCVEQRCEEAERLGVRIAEDPTRNKYDLLVPCASERTITSELARELQVEFICGAANHPLQDEHTEEILFSRGILYVPDWISSSGAIVLDDLIIEGKPLDMILAKRRINRIFDVTLEILSESERLQVKTSDVAEKVVGEKHE